MTLMCGLFLQTDPTKVGKDVESPPKKKGKPDIKSDVRRKPDKDADKQKITKYPVKSIGTLQPYIAEPASFNIYIKPHEILGHSPLVLQKPYSAPIDHGRKAAQKTRPRLVVSPGMAFDNIEKDEIRDLVVFDTYHSEKMNTDRLLEESLYGTSIKAPMSGKFAYSKPIDLPKLRPPVPVVPPEWRMESRDWDRKNLRGHCDATKEFWAKFRPKHIL